MADFTGENLSGSQFNLRAVLGDPSPWHPLDLPHDEMQDEMQDEPSVPRDRDGRRR